MKIAAGLAAAGALAAGSLHATLTTAGHTPKANVHWPYTVHATIGGKPARARVTARIVDPLGGVHPVEFGASKANVTKIAFHGTFRDYVIWPTDSVGFPLTFRIIVTSGTTKRVIDYKVTVKK